MRDQYMNYCYVTIFASLAMTVLYCTAVYRWWPINTETCWIDDCYVEKENLARKISDRPKIVFGGGSGTIMGVRTKDVQKAFGVPTVNMGLHAGVEIDYILYRLKRVLRQGDVVILPLEYEHFVYDGRSNSLKISFVASCDREYFLGLSWWSKAQYTFSLIGFNKVLEALKSKRPRGTSTRHWVLNQNGDATGYAGTAVVVKESQFECTPLPVQRDGFTETYGLALIREFSRWCEARGIRCYVTYANLVYLKDYADERYHTYFESLQNYFIKNDIAFIGTPYDFFFPRKLFYNTEYHLNQEGITLRTEQLIVMMRKMNIVPRPKR